MIRHIHTYLQEKVDANVPTKDIAIDLAITPAMVGQYRLRRGYKPSIKVAIKVFTMDGVVLHPYSKESLEWEIKNA